MWEEEEEEDEEEEEEEEEDEDADAERGDHDHTTPLAKEEKGLGQDTVCVCNVAGFSAGVGEGAGGVAGRKRVP